MAARGGWQAEPVVEPESWPALLVTRIASRLKTGPARFGADYRGLTSQATQLSATAI